MTEPVLETVNSVKGMYQRLAREVSWGLNGGGSGDFEVWHSEWKPETAEVLVHDFSYTDEDGIEWRGEFKLTLSGLDAHVDEDDWEEDDWEEDDWEED